MSNDSLLTEAGRVDEPHGAQEYSAVLTKVASQGRPVIVQRNGEDLAAIIPLPFFELVCEVLARQEVERLAEQIDWKKVPVTPPPQSWFDDNDNPFEPEVGS